MSFLGNIRKIKPEEMLAYAEISSVCFEYAFEGSHDSQVFYEKTVGDAENATHRSGKYIRDKYVAELEGQVIAGVCAIAYQAEFDGQQAGLCGIGGVCTLPSFRRHGAVRGIMEQILRDEAEKGTEFSFLYPFSQGYYEKFGFVQSEPTVQYTISLRHLAQTKYQGHFTLYRGDRNIEGFQAAYDRMTGYNLRILRERCDYGVLLGTNPYEKNEFAYLYTDESHIPRGYLVFSKETEQTGAVMQVKELVYDSFAALQAILAFAGSFSTDYPLIRFTAPTGQLLERLSSDQALGTFQRAVQACGMVRVIDVVNTLKKAKYRGSGEAVLRIEDPTLQKMHQLALSWTDGKLTDCAVTNRDPYCEMNIRDFSAAIIGRFTIEDFPYLPSVICRKPEKVAGIFYKKPVFISNYF